MYTTYIHSYTQYVLLLLHRVAFFRSLTGASPNQLPTSYRA
jgi:hypothetical protein